MSKTITIPGMMDYELELITDHSDLVRAVPVGAVRFKLIKPNLKFYIMRVQGDEIECSCMGWINRRHCKHSRELKATLLEMAHGRAGNLEARIKSLFEEVGL